MNDNEKFDLVIAIILSAICAYLGYAIYQLIF